LTKTAKSGFGVKGVKGLLKQTLWLKKENRCIIYEG
jgi:hypothetical protein